MRIADRNFAGSAGLLLLSCCGISAFAPAVAPADEINSIVLRVNDEIATRYDYTERRDARVAAISEARDVDPEERRKYLSEAPRATLREMLDELLLVSRARQLVIEPSRSEIEEAVDNMRQRLGFASEEALMAALESSNMSMDDYRERTARQLKSTQVIQREVNPLVKVEDEWLQRYYREHQDQFRVPARVKLRELVLPADKVSGKAALDLADQIRTALAAGEEMGAVAARLGGGTGVAATEGGEVDTGRIVGPVDLGWVQPGELAPELDALVWSLPPGALSAPTTARGGLHLVEVQERVESTIRPYVDVKSDIERQERDRRHDDVMRKYLGDLEKKALIVENIPAEAAGFREIGASDDADPRAAFAPKRPAAPPGPPEMDRMPVGTPGASAPPSESAPPTAPPAPVTPPGLL